MAERSHSAEQKAVPARLRERRLPGMLPAYPELRRQKSLIGLRGTVPSRHGLDRSPGRRCSAFTGCVTGLRLDLAALFASIDDALADSGSC